MRVYVDQYGRYHDRSVYPLDPLPSNNAYAYTATAKLLGIPLNMEKIRACYHVSRTKYSFHRHPDVTLPPTSRDEIQGALILGLLSPKQLINQDFYFCNLGDPKKASIFTQVKTLWDLRNRHRNAVWAKPEVWNWAFTLPLQDQWFVMKLAKKKPSLLQTSAFYISSLLTLHKKRPSNLMILWQKLEHLGMRDSWLYKQINLPETVDLYFGKEHIFSVYCR